MNNFIDAMRGATLWVFHRTARPGSYTPLGGAATSLDAFVRGLREEDAFAGAMQSDNVAVISADDFAAAFGAEMPKRLDRLRMGAMTYAVESWRGSPNDTAPVFYKLLVRGGQQ